MGDGFNLGFVEETENQVAEHLQSHLDIIENKDLRTVAIISQMKKDEQEHAKIAANAGAKQLPLFVKTIMSKTSKVMTKLSFYL